MKTHSFKSLACQHLLLVTPLLVLAATAKAQQLPVAGTVQVTAMTPADHSTLYTTGNTVATKGSMTWTATASVTGAVVGYRLNFYDSNGMDAGWIANHQTVAKGTTTPSTKIEGDFVFPLGRLTGVADCVISAPDAEAQGSLGSTTFDVSPEPVPLTP